MVGYLAKLFLLLQLILVAAALFGEKFIPIKAETFLGRSLGELIDHYLIWSRANFDGVHHISIARCGYGYLQQAFFPFYAKLISFFQHYFFKGFIVSGIFISSVSFLISLILMADLFRKAGEKEETVKKSLLFLAIFPTSFYFTFVYAESLFLMLVLLSFWWAKRKRWLLAGLIAGLASYTRLTGIFLLPALLYEYYEGESKRAMKERIVAAKNSLVSKINPRYFFYFLKTRAYHIKNFLFILTSSWGLLYYMDFLQRMKGDPFYFIRVQPDFGAQRSIGKVIMLYQVFWRYLKMILTVNPKTLIYFNVWLELLLTLLFLYLLLLGWLKFKISHSWMIFATLAYVLPSLTGTFSSMPRYVLVCFPCFLVLAKIKIPRLVYLLSVLFLFALSALFMRGYWIA